MQSFFRETSDYMRRSIFSLPRQKIGQLEKESSKNHERQKETLSEEVLLEGYIHAVQAHTPSSGNRFKESQHKESSGLKE